MADEELKKLVNFFDRFADNPQYPKGKVVNEKVHDKCTCCQPKKVVHVHAVWKSEKMKNEIKVLEKV